MGNIFNLQQKNTSNRKITGSNTNRITAVPVSNVSPASVLRQVETRPLQGLPNNINRSVKQVNVKNTLPSITKIKGLIDVINNFDWTTTPTRAGAGQDFKVPSVRIQEFEMNRLSVINSIRYQLQAFSSIIDDNADAVKATINAVGNASADALPQDNSTSNKFGNVVGNAVIELNKVFANAASVAQIDDLANFVQRSTAGFTSVLGSLGSKSESDSNSQWLKMLNGLYTLTSTQFEYIFPYFENRAMDANPRFANFDAVLKGGISKGIASGVSNKIQGELLSLPELSQPGVYIEQPQLMDISSSSGSDITVTFPLLNTLSFEGAVKNYQLLWLLAFQNKPYRESITVVSPAKVYRVYIPGIKYMHFAHISNLSVDFLGVRRTVSIPMPTVAGTPNQVNVVMPDAYKVSITFKSLTTDMGNLMIEQLKRGAQF
jgi:hypothetical protein